MRGMIPWRPLAEMGPTDDLLRRFFGSDRWLPMIRAPWMEEAFPFAPHANLVETPTAYEVTAELPGLKPEEFQVELREGALWVTGEKVEEKSEDGQTFHQVERRFGKFERMFVLPAAVKEQEITAEFKDGVLKVVVPKAEEVKPKPILVKT
jgi:HSP20 family protein